jgi:hypothetical protein
MTSAYGRLRDMYKNTNDNPANNKLGMFERKRLKRSLSVNFCRGEARSLLIQDPYSSLRKAAE